MFEVDDETEQTVISRKLEKKLNASECHIDVLRIDEDDNNHYVSKKCCRRL